MGATGPTWRMAGAAIALAMVPASVLARDDVRVIPLASATASVDARGPGETKLDGFEARQLPARAIQGELSVTVDRAKVIRLPEKTQTVIIGNPGVADIAIQKNGVVVLTGKSFGVTNFIAIDATGSQIAESMVSVTAPTESILMVQRGLERQTYSCAPVCQPTVALGDAPGYFGETRGQVDAHGSFIGQR